MLYAAYLRNASSVRGSDGASSDRDNGQWLPDCDGYRCSGKSDRWQVKYCPGCAATKPMTDFGANAARKDGVQAKCKVCTAADMRTWKRGNPDKVAAWKRPTPKQVNDG